MGLFRRRRPEISSPPVLQSWEPKPLPDPPYRPRVGPPPAAGTGIVTLRRRGRIVGSIDASDVDAFPGYHHD